MPEDQSGGARTLTWLALAGAALVAVTAGATVVLVGSLRGRPAGATDAAGETGPAGESEDVQLPPVEEPLPPSPYTARVSFAQPAPVVEPPAASAPVPAPAPVSAPAPVPAPAPGPAPVPGPAPARAVPASDRAWPELPPIEAYYPEGLYRANPPVDESWPYEDDLPVAPRRAAGPHRDDQGPSPRRAR